MKVLISLGAVIILILIAVIGISLADLYFLFGVIIPYAALVVFIAGIIYRVIIWGRSSVPFSIPTTCGQQKSLAWIKQDRIENPSGMPGVLIRMAFEVLLFRSLFRNTKMEFKEGRLSYGSDKWLWAAGLAFHWSFFLITSRHWRFFAEPAPVFVALLEGLDGFLQIGAPVFYMTDIVLVSSATYLFLRRLFIPQLRYLSLAADYFQLFLIVAIACSGMLMRYYFMVDVVAVKELVMGLVSFNPIIPRPEWVGIIFYVHLFLVSSFFAYFSFSKLVHMAGVFLSPTRNMPNNSRRVRHINPWNYPVKVHTYEEYEDEFRAKMKDAGIPVEKE